VDTAFFQVTPQSNGAKRPARLRHRGGQRVQQTAKYGYLEPLGQPVQIFHFGRLLRIAKNDFFTVDRQPKLYVGGQPRHVLKLSRHPENDHRGQIERFPLPVDLALFVLVMRQPS
jgi:hypothetical protein